MNLTKAAEELISDLADSLEIPAERYASAERSYQSLAKWLERQGSRFQGITTRVYVQGSFRLGTAIRPLNGEEHYDLDVVCEFAVSKSRYTQQLLQEHLGYELQAYAVRYEMDAPDQWERCWTMNYADKAQFHMDVLPSTPDGLRQITILASRNMSNPYTQKSISITDSKDSRFQLLTDDWPTSNPDGYAEWFYIRMKPLLEKRKVGAIFADAEVADIPKFKNKTPLQSAIQILKRHRDIRFMDTPDLKPSSIIITTLAAHAYGQEERVSDALYAILERMEEGIKGSAESTRLENPADPRENFADSWRADPDKRVAFFDWLQGLRADFANAAQLGDADSLVQALAPKLGRQMVEKAASMRQNPSGISSSSTVPQIVKNAISLVLSAPHREPLPWSLRLKSYVDLISTQAKFGFRMQDIPQSGAPVQSGMTLRFKAKTDVPKPYAVYWQIVNTGIAAANARNLRGGFDEDRIERGNLTREETARYPGTHSIECFIVKDGVCLARTGPFIVNIVR